MQRSSQKRVPDSTWQNGTDGKKFRPDNNGQDDAVAAAFEIIRLSFPLGRFQHHFPPVILRHQLYSVVRNKSRTEIDRQINVLRQSHALKSFKLDLRGDELALVRTDDFREHVRGFARDYRLKNPLVVEKFLDLIEGHDICISTADLKKDRMFSDEDIQSLVSIGTLIVKDVGWWWVSFPGAGQFMKAFTSGREKVLTMIKKGKYSSVLESDLIARSLPKRCLGTEYHVHDVIGSELVET